MKYFHLFLFILISFGIFSCKKKQEHSSDIYELTLPVGFPQPKIPEKNPLTKKKIQLGKRLFYDTALSKDSTISCASCHKQELAFADNKAVSPGIEGKLGFRNAPSLANVAFLGRVHKDGGVPHIDFQPIVPIEDEFEMGMKIQGLADRLNQDPTYVKLFEGAFDELATPFTITRAIASFERTLISGESKYDHVMRGEAFFSEEEQRGYELFNSTKTQCSTCHSGFNFTNNEFINNGLYLDYSKDKGRQRVTIDNADIGKFRVPSLRNIALTAPYMHDGSLKNLEEVVAHYTSGGQAHPNKSDTIQPINLATNEITDLLAFLETLTDNNFITNPDFQ